MTYLIISLVVAISVTPKVRGLDCALIFVHGEVDIMPLQEQAMRTAVHDLEKAKHIDVHISELINVTVKGRIPKTVLDSMCQALDQAIQSKKTPFILDMTSGGVPAETIKSFSAAMAIPTITTSVGKVGDIKAWHAIDDDQEKYLVQIAPPADILLEIVRPIVAQLKIANVAIIYGEAYVPSFKSHARSIESMIDGRVISRGIGGDIRHQLSELHSKLKYDNFFVFGRAVEIEQVLNEADDLRYLQETRWFAASLQNESIAFNGDLSFVMMLPVVQPGNEDILQNVVNREHLQGMAPIDGAFYYDVAVRAILAAQEIANAGKWPSSDYFVSCNSFSVEHVRHLEDLDLRSAVIKVNHPWTFAPFSYGLNGESIMAFNVSLEKWTYSKQASNVKIEALGNWLAGYDSPVNMLQSDSDSVQITRKRPFYRVVTLEQEPFVIKTKDKFSGLCIDLLTNISMLLDFDYEIYDIPGASMGFLNDNGEWTGIVNELLEKRADIGMTAISIMVERERVIDFTLPYYEPVGISILMKKSQSATSLFKFLTVLEADVWLCILTAYFLTSILMWVFDRWSPYSYQNNIEKYKDDEEKRIFNFKECLWFCLTSLTPQGGGEAPKNLSGRLVAATWWLFGFIIMASYTANLAAFLTVSRLDTPIESLDDLSKQYKIRYAPLKDSSEMKYFKRMANIENNFYEIWKDMSLNDSLTALERSKLAVWDYPVSDKFTKMWQAMQEAGMPNGMDEALARIFNDSPAAEPFALLNDASENFYYFHTNCDLQIVGDQFSRKPYAIALQKGSHLRDPINNILQELTNQGELIRLKNYWWDKVTIRKRCEELKEEEDGISIKNIGGVFIVIVLGIGFAILTLTIEYAWYQYQRRNSPTSSSGTWADPTGQVHQADEAAKFANKYLDPHNLYGDHFTRRSNVQKVVSNNYYHW